MIGAERVDILMPTYRAARFIGSAVGSTLRSMGKFDRLLIHIDGMDPETERILERFSGEKRILVSKSKKNLGVWSSLNSLAANVDADFVARMDSDDVCLPWRFSFQKKFLRAKDLQMVFSPAIMISSGRIATFPRFLPIRGVKQAVSNPAHTLTKYNPLFTSSSFMDNETFQLQRPFNEGFEDYKSWLKACLAGKKLGVSLLPVIAYRRQALQVSSTEHYKNLGNDDPELFELRGQLDSYLKI